MAPALPATWRCGSAAQLSRPGTTAVSCCGIRWTRVSEHTLHVTLNGQPRTVTVPANRLLVHLLRDDLGLTGTKEGCSVGVCGACSVLVDGVLVSACLLPAVMLDGATITTVEGLA